ncbi:MAG: hypothetical protein OXC31_15045 [Spirochaetaceae bacterium]|nr:hypothetical protein [Spirochaetaceae bacterium]
MIGAAVMTAACASTPPSLARASLGAMPADVDVAVAARVAALRAPIAAVVEQAQVPVPGWLLERLAVVVAGVYVGAEPGYLIWMRGVALDRGMTARLLLSPDWFYVGAPFPHYRSADAAAWLAGGDVLVMTNLPLDRVQRAFDAEAFSLPADVAIEERDADVLLVVPDLTDAIDRMVPDSGLDLVTEVFPTQDVWLSGTASADGLVIAGAMRTVDRNLARLLAAFASGQLTLADVRLRADGTWVRLAGLMRHDELMDVARAMLNLEELGPAGGSEGGP